MYSETSLQKQPQLDLPGLADVDRAIVAMGGLREYVRLAWSIVEPSTEYVHGWHIDAICDHLEAVTRGEIRNLLINVPPRSMKSLLTCVMWPTWEWTWHPEERWLFSSYSDALAIRDSLKCRRIIQSNWYQERWGDVFALTGDQNQKTRFENDKSGFRLATGVGGAATGEGGGKIVCLPGYAYIKTEQGEIRIDEIVSQEMNVNVLTFNHDTEQVEFQPVLRHEENPGRTLVEIDLDDRTLTCTEDHPVYVEGKGYVKARDIQAGDVVVTTA